MSCSAEIYGDHHLDSQGRLILASAGLAVKVAEKVWGSSWRKSYKVVGSDETGYMLVDITKERG